MQVQDDGIVLYQTKPSGRGSVLSILLKQSGRYVGFMKKNRTKIDVGQRVECLWEGRLDDDLGRWSLTTQDAQIPWILWDRLSLGLLSYMCPLLHLIAPEREQVFPLYDALEQLKKKKNLLHKLRDWIFMECVILNHLGAALKLNACGVSGKIDNLDYISPKTGRAIHKEVGHHYKDRLFKNSPILLGHTSDNIVEHIETLNVTGYFIEKNLRSGYLPDTKTCIFDHRMRLYNRVKNMHEPYV